MYTELPIVIGNSNSKGSVIDLIRDIQPEYDDIILNLCTSTNEIDYWRISNPTSIHIVTISPGNGQCSDQSTGSSLVSCAMIGYQINQKNLVTEKCIEDGVN